MPEIGAKLLKDGLITESDLRLAETRERETGINVATCLVDLGKVEEASLCGYLAAAAHVPFIDDAALGRVSVDLTSFVSAVTAGRFQAVPIDFTEGRLLVATSDPDLLKHLDPIGKDSGHPIDAAIATRTGIADALERLYQITEATVPVDISEDSVRTLRDDPSEVPDDQQESVTRSAVRDHLQIELPPTEPTMASVPADGLDLSGSPPTRPWLQAGDARQTLPLRSGSGRGAARTMDAMARPPKLAGGRFEDRYEIIKEIGAGGMAQVHLAEVKGAEGFHRKVVIKKILPSLIQDRQFREMFIDEAKITCQLSHPNIVQLYELAEDRGQIYMVMEYVEGIDLGTLFRQAAGLGPKLTPSIAAYIVEQLCEGLDYAHKRTDDHGEPLGIVHRDVTPANVLLSYDGHVKVIDFGIALAAENTSVTQVGSLKGKPGYISPEQAEGKPLDHRSDVFAAGIIFYELLMHKRLFRDALGAYELREVVEFDPRPKLRWKFRFPAALRAAASWALQASKEERCPDAAELASLLRDYLRKRREDPRLELQKYISAHIAKPD